LRLKEQAVLFSILVGSTLSPRFRLNNCCT
jgi:hypothetical protein